MRTLRVAHEPAGAGAARRQVVGELADRGLPSAAVEDAALVVSELVGNAVRHGAPLPDGGGVCVGWEVDGPVLRLEVCDGGGGPEDVTADGEVLEQPPLSAEGGRGLALVATVAARWGAAVRGGVTCVRAELPVGAPAERWSTA